MGMCWVCALTVSAHAFFWARYKLADWLSASLFPYFGAVDDPTAVAVPHHAGLALTMLGWLLAFCVLECRGTVEDDDSTGTATPTSSSTRRRGGKKGR
eukprot:SAG11_NODE_1743_length_4335_cov_1.760387_3_plen_98_part_00